MFCCRRSSSLHSPCSARTSAVLAWLRSSRDLQGGSTGGCSSRREPLHVPRHTHCCRPAARLPCSNCPAASAVPAHLTWPMSCLRRPWLLLSPPPMLSLALRIGASKRTPNYRPGTQMQTQVPSAACRLSTRRKGSRSSPLEPPNEFAPRENCVPPAVLHTDMMPAPSRSSHSSY